MKQCLGYAHQFFGQCPLTCTSFLPVVGGIGVVEKFCQVCATVLSGVVEGLPMQLSNLLYGLLYQWFHIGGAKGSSGTKNQGQCLPSCLVLPRGICEAPLSTAVLLKYLPTPCPFRNMNQKLKFQRPWVFFL